MLQFACNFPVLPFTQVLTPGRLTGPEAHWIVVGILNENGLGQMATDIDASHDGKPPQPNSWFYWFAHALAQGWLDQSRYLAITLFPYIPKCFQLQLLKDSREGQ